MMPSRRCFVQAIAVLAVTPLIPGCRSPQPPIDTPLARLARGLTGADWNALGDARSPEQIMETLSERIAPAVASGVALELALAGQIANEHAAGHWLDWSGWQLARTEFDLLALARGLSLAAGDVAARLAFVDGHIVDVLDWAPREVLAGIAFNVQPDGHSALWFTLAPGGPADGLQVEVAGRRVRSLHRGEVVTVRFEREDLAQMFGLPAAHPVALLDSVRGIRQPVGSLVVTRADETAARYWLAKDVMRENG